MGYESRLIIGITTTFDAINTRTKKPDSRYKWFQVYAEINVSKMDGLDIPPNLQKVYIYGLNGNTQIKKDKYGEQLVAIPAKIVLNQLIAKDAKYGDHMRLKWGISLIEHMIELSGERENIEIVHFGY